MRKRALLHDGSHRYATCTCLDGYISPIQEKGLKNSENNFKIPVFRLRVYCYHLLYYCVQKKRHPLFKEARFRLAALNVFVEERPVRQRYLVLRGVWPITTFAPPSPREQIQSFRTKGRFTRDHSLAPQSGGARPRVRRLCDAALWHHTAADLTAEMRSSPSDWAVHAHDSDQYERCSVTERTSCCFCFCAKKFVKFFGRKRRYWVHSLLQPRAEKGLHHTLYDDLHIYIYICIESVLLETLGIFYKSLDNAHWIIHIDTDYHRFFSNKREQIWNPLHRTPFYGASQFQYQVLKWTIIQRSLQSFLFLTKFIRI